MKIRAEGLELKNCLIGLYRYQINKLEELCERYNKNRSELIREAVDLLIRGAELRDEKEEEEKGE